MKKSPFIRLIKSTLSFLYHHREISSTRLNFFETLFSHLFKKNRINEDDFPMLKGVLSLSEKQVKDIMVPIEMAQTLKQNLTIAQALQQIKETKFSRYPICNPDTNKIQGLLLTKHLITKLDHTQSWLDRPIGQLMRTKPLCLPESQRLDHSLRTFQRLKKHMALVVDEFQNVTGMITLEDIIEEIIGDVTDEFEDQPQLGIQSRGSTHIVDGDVLLESVNTHFKTQLSSKFHTTISGWVCEYLGQIPAPLKEFKVDQWRIKIIKANKKRIEQIEITKW
jgi:magnesium and cobalt transporter